MCTNNIWFYKENQKKKNAFNNHLMKSFSYLSLRSLPGGYFITSFSSNFENPKSTGKLLGCLWHVFMKKNKRKTNTSF